MKKIREPVAAWSFLFFRQLEILQVAKALCVCVCVCVIRKIRNYWFSPLFLSSIISSADG